MPETHFTDVPSDQVPEIYHDRSPLHKAEKITASLLVLQGLDDKVVPPEQGMAA
jgi:dipeptidyl aminopeptidase/acylaminoacyl peptidase